MAVPAPAQPGRFCRPRPDYLHWATPGPAPDASCPVNAPALPVPPALPATYRDALALLCRQPGPRALVLLVAALAAARVALAPWSWRDTALLAAWLALRGPLEWVLHTYVWHARPLPLLRVSLPNTITRMHREHHGNPHDPGTLFFGWRNITLATAALLAGGALVLPWTLALTGVLGVLLVTSAYEWCHLVAHSRIRPRSALFRHVIASHRHHHFRDEHRCMGVSSTLGDRLFGTAASGDGEP